MAKDRERERLVALASALHDAIEREIDALLSGAELNCAVGVALVAIRTTGASPPGSTPSHVDLLRRGLVSFDSERHDALSGRFRLTEVGEAAALAFEAAEAKVVRRMLRGIGEAELEAATRALREVVARAFADRSFDG